MSSLILLSAIYKIHYNSAKFYSKIEDYQTSIKLCERAIALNKEKGTLHYYDLLYYELGFNKNKLNQEAMLEYKTAYYLARCTGNQVLVKVILEDAKRYDLPFQMDEHGVI